MIRNTTRRVLVVDDEPSVREMLSDFLEMNNFICMQADNGESAVAVTRKERWDLIIMDIRMPGVSGIEALREIKRD
jgi:DNA-binding response OmpR family regulator